MINTILKFCMWGVATFGIYLATFGSYYVWETGDTLLSGFVLVSGFFITVVSVYSYLEFQNELEKK